RQMAKEIGLDRNRKQQEKFKDEAKAECIARNSPIHGRVHQGDINPFDYVRNAEAFLAQHSYKTTNIE
ncbi:hypothetical protein IW140_003602, partial [Coemansia sp. RSA 1813]